MMQALLTSRPEATLLPEPAVVTFTGYEVNCRHEQAVRFRNLSNLGKRIRSETAAKQHAYLNCSTCLVCHQSAPTLFSFFAMITHAVLHMLSSAGPPTLQEAPALALGTLNP